MPLKFDLETTSITLPLDTVLELVKAARGAAELSPDTLALVQLEAAAVLCGLEGLEEEVLRGIVRDSLGVLAAP